MCIDENQNVQYYGIYARFKGNAKHTDKYNDALDIAKLALPESAILFAEFITEKEYSRDYTIDEVLA